MQRSSALQKPQSRAHFPLSTLIALQIIRRPFLHPAYLQSRGLFLLLQNITRLYCHSHLSTVLLPPTCLTRWQPIPYRLSFVSRLSKQNLAKLPTSTTSNPQCLKDSPEVTSASLTRPLVRRTPRCSRITKVDVSMQASLVPRTLLARKQDLRIMKSGCLTTQPTNQSMDLLAEPKHGKPNLLLATSKRDARTSHLQ